MKNKLIMKIKRIDLMDTSFLIYAQIESEDRRINLSLVINYIHKYFNTNILLLEIDAVPKIDDEYILNNKGTEYEFIQDSSEIFHTTKYRNLLVTKCKTPYFFICDSDIILSPKGIEQSIEYLRAAILPTLVYPYNGDFHQVFENDRNKFAKMLDYDFFQGREKEFTFMHKYSVGGAFGGRIIDYLEQTIDNEKIYGWGPDDKERYYRLKKNGFKMVRFDYPLFHLYHIRKKNSKPSDIDLTTKNNIEYLKVFMP
ncbi:MAG: galactosyltransferase-related protein [Algibacter sp.]